MKKALTNKACNLIGMHDGITGKISPSLRGDISGLSGVISPELRGDITVCGAKSLPNLVAILLIVV